MRLDTTPEFEEGLSEAMSYIAADSPQRAVQFAHELHEAARGLAVMPLRFRKSIYFDSDRIRDLIFKGYTVPYLVETDRILLIELIKWRKPKQAGL